MKRSQDPVTKWLPNRTLLPHCLWWVLYEESGMLKERSHPCWRFRRFYWNAFFNRRKHRPSFPSLGKQPIIPPNYLLVLRGLSCVIAFNYFSSNTECRLDHGSSSALKLSYLRWKSVSEQLFLQLNLLRGRQNVSSPPQPSSLDWTHISSKSRQRWVSAIRHSTIYNLKGLLGYERMGSMQHQKEHNVNRRKACRKQT